MALVEWKSIYETKVSEVDAQHKKLVSIVNELHAAMTMGKGKEILSNVFNELVEYTLYHFSTEEKYFDQYAYPEADLHKKQHKDLVEQVATLKSKYEAGEKVLTLEVMNFLRDWLHDHIIGSDKLFGPYLKSKGVD